MEYRISDEIQIKDRNEIYQGLLEYNLARLEDQHPKDLGIYLENEKGDKLAGLIGETHGKWLTISYLWVSEPLRGQQIGSSILKKAELTGLERGCNYVFLDTFGFQAPDFYQKHGYQEVFVLNEYPCTGTRHYFTKSLEGDCI